MFGKSSSPQLKERTSWCSPQQFGETWRVGGGGGGGIMSRVVAAISGDPTWPIGTTHQLTMSP